MYKKENNRFLRKENFVEMKVQYKEEWLTVYIDIEDEDLVKSYRWRASRKKNKIYLVTGQSASKTLQYLHNLIMNYTPMDGYEIDHLDGNSLNDRKENLKLVTRRRNIENTRVRIDNKIGIRGICQITGKFKVDFSNNKIRFYFRDWDTLEEAVYCRKYAEEYFNISILNKNPLAAPLLTLSAEAANTIKSYVHEVIQKKIS